MSLRITAAGVTSTASGHAAHRDTNGTWRVSWFAGRVLTIPNAVTAPAALAAVAAAELVSAGVTTARHEGWALLNDFATALGLTADAAVHLIQEYR